MTTCRLSEYAEANGCARDGQTFSNCIYSVIASRMRFTFIASTHFRGFSTSHLLVICLIEELVNLSYKYASAANAIY